MRRDEAGEGEDLTCAPAVAQHAAGFSRHVRRVHHPFQEVVQPGRAEAAGRRHRLQQLPVPARHQDWLLRILYEVQPVLHHTRSYCINDLSRLQHCGTATHPTASTAKCHALFQSDSFRLDNRIGCCASAMNSSQYCTTSEASALSTSLAQLLQHSGAAVRPTASTMKC